MLNSIVNNVYKIIIEKRCFYIYVKKYFQNIDLFIALSTFLYWFIQFLCENGNIFINRE